MRVGEDDKRLRLRLSLNDIPLTPLSLIANHAVILPTLPLRGGDPALTDHMSGLPTRDPDQIEELVSVIVTQCLNFLGQVPAVFGDDCSGEGGDAFILGGG